MAGELCNRGCGFCGRCDAPWDAEPEPIDDEPDAEFHESMAEATEELIRKANNDEIYTAAVRRWFRQTDVA